MPAEERDRQHPGSIVGAKIAATLVLGLGSFALGVLPAWMAQRRRPGAASGGRRRLRGVHHDHRRGQRHGHRGPGVSDSAAASPMIVFGGGVLFYTSLVHLLPEVRESADALRRVGRPPFGDVESLVDLVFCAGFFATCVADQLAHAALAWRRRGPAPRASAPDELDGVRPNRWSVLPDAVAGPSRWSVLPDDDERDADAEPDRSLPGLFAVLALSFHGVFEGLALGLERRPEYVWQLFFAVASHKFVIAFCVGLGLACSDTRRAAFLVYVAAFATVTPAGVAFGMAIDRFDDRATVDGLQGPAAVILQAFAAGTLLYVVFFEIFPEQNKSGGWPRLLAFVLGFVVMMLLRKITHNHSHGHHDDHDHGYNHYHFGHDH